MRPARPATCGSHLVQSQAQRSLPKRWRDAFRAASSSPTGVRWGRFAAVLRVGRNDLRHWTPQPAQALLPSLRSIAFCKRNLRARAREPLPFRAGGNRRLLYFSLPHRASHLVGPIDCRSFVSLCPGCIAECLTGRKVTSPKKAWPVQFVCIAKNICAALCKTGKAPHHRHVSRVSWGQLISLSLPPREHSRYSRGYGGFDNGAGERKQR
jgi:hypothetical protein